MEKKKKIKKEKEKDEDLYDDCNCTVCQAMKFAQENGRMPTLSELKEAFKKSKKFKK